MPDSASGPTATSRRPTLGDGARRAIITVLILGALVGIFFTGKAAVTGSDAGSSNLPDSVDQLIPVRGGEVPRQSPVGIDVAEGYDAYLVLNGQEIRTAADGLIKDLGTGLVQFQPAQGLAIEALQTGQNCVVAFVWDQLEEPETASPVSWCFSAY